LTLLSKEKTAPESGCEWPFAKREKAQPEPRLSVFAYISIIEKSEKSPAFLSR
jgi:hypothetical protein